jgi:hypothetical protein
VIFVFFVVQSLFLVTGNAMRISWIIAAAIALPLVASAHEADPAYLATLHNDGGGLPRGLAPSESVPRWLAPHAPTGAPGGHVRAIAEYEPTAGILITWGGYNALHTAMAVPLTTASPPSDLWIVVDDASEQSSATTVLTNGGADLAHVHFIVAQTDSVWMRDYGPRFVEH